MKPYPKSGVSFLAKRGIAFSEIAKRLSRFEEVAQKYLKEYRMPKRTGDAYTLLFSK